jgi:hypothetical protein
MLTLTLTTRLAGSVNPAAANRPVATGTRGPARRPALGASSTRTRLWTLRQRGARATRRTGTTRRRAAHVLLTRSGRRTVARGAPLPVHLLRRAALSGRCAQRCISQHATKWRGATCCSQGAVELPPVERDDRVEALWADARTAKTLNQGARAQAQQWPRARVGQGEAAREAARARVEGQSDAREIVCGVATRRGARTTRARSRSRAEG